MNRRMDASYGQVKLQRLMAVWKLSHVLDGPHEIVTLTASLAPRSGQFTAMAPRTWVSDVDGTGVEVDQMEPNRF